MKTKCNILKISLKNNFNHNPKKRSASAKCITEETVLNSVLIVMCFFKNGKVKWLCRL